MLEAGTARHHAWLVAQGGACTEERSQQVSGGESRPPQTSPNPLRNLCRVPCHAGWQTQVIHAPRLEAEAGRRARIGEPMYLLFQISDKAPTLCFHEKNLVARYALVRIGLNVFHETPLQLGETP